MHPIFSGRPGIDRPDCLGTRHQLAADRRRVGCRVGLCGWGVYQTDLLISGAAKVDRELAIGDLSAGQHALRIAFNASHSSPQARTIKLAAITVRTVQVSNPAFVALEHVPIVYWRSLAAYGGPMQNQWTDAPLVGWHYSTANADGTTMLEDQTVWSNEDGGTDTEPPSEQARWGRMTDIEWIYRVTVDKDGVTVPCAETYQSPGHGDVAFAGAHEGAHSGDADLHRQQQHM